MTQLEAIYRAIEYCGSINQLHKRSLVSRTTIYAMRRRAKKLEAMFDLCKMDIALQIEMGTDGEISWKYLCPGTWAQVVEE